MAITVTLPTVLARFAGGTRTHLVGGASVGEALDQLVRDFPEFGPRLTQATAPDNSFVAVYLNDEDTRFLGGSSAPVAAGDRITLVSAIAGG